MADLKLDQLDPFLPPMQDNDLFLVKMKRRTSMIGDEDRGITWAQLKTEINLDRYMLNTGGNFTGNVAFNYNVGVQGKTAANATRNVAKIGSLPTSPAQPSTVLIGDPTLNLAVQSAGVPQYWDGSNAFNFITEKNLPAPSDLSAGGAYTKTESDTALNTKFDKVGGDIAGDTILANGRSLRSRTSTNAIVTLAGMTTGNLIFLGNQTTPVQIQSSVIPQVKVGAGALSNIWGDFNKPLPSALGNGGTTGAYTKAEVDSKFLAYLPLTGGVISGKTTVNNNVHFVTQTGNNNPNTAAPAGTEVDIFYAGTNSLAIGDVKQPTLIRGFGILTHNDGTQSYQVYTTGNKPSSNDITRSTGTASGITASLNLADSALQKGAYGLGAKAVNIPSTVTSLSDDTITVMTGWWTAAGTYTDAPVDLSSSGQPVGIIFSTRRAFEAGCALVQILYVAGGVQYIRTAPAPVSGVWNWHGTSQGADANGWRRVYDQAVKPTTTELNVYTKGEADGRFANLGSDGSNLDIKILNGLTGALKVGANASNPLEVTTLQQVQAMTSGTAGAVVGVVGGFIGAVQWFNGTRATIPAGWIPADGQLVLRSDYPDLWNAVNAKALGQTTDTIWNTSNTGRANYSTGTITTGATANFRTPDLNGCQAGSVPALFLRGDANGTTSAAAVGSSGSVRENRAPDITGTVDGVMDFRTPTGAFGNGNLSGTGIGSQAGNAYHLLTFAASASHPAYGRKYDPSAPATNEISPNYASGVWIIRASNNYEAANTQFTVYNGLASAPSATTTYTGGTLTSRFDVANVTQMLANLFVTKASNTNVATAMLQVVNKGNGGSIPETSYQFAFNSNGAMSVGTLTASGNVIAGGLVSNGAMSTVQGAVIGGELQVGGKASVNTNLAILGSNDVNSTQGYLSFRNAAGQQYAAIYSERAGDLTFLTNGQGGLGYVTMTKAANITSNAYGTVQWAASDAKLKDKIVDAVSGAPERINAIRVREFDWKSDGRHDRGYIAQELEKIDPTYVYESAGIKNVSNTALVADLIATVQSLTKRVAELESR